MKHLKKERKFGRVRKQRRALGKVLLGNLILHEKMKTTEAKAKEIKGAVDQVINKAKKYNGSGNKVMAMRYLKERIPELAVKKITGEFLEKFRERGSGYTRIIKLSPRKSDNAKMAVIEFVD